MTIIYSENPFHQAQERLDYITPQLNPVNIELEAANMAQQGGMFFCEQIELQANLATEEPLIRVERVDEIQTDIFSKHDK